MGLRDRWEFKYTASKLTEAARTKRDHHRERQKWWEEAKAKVMVEVRESGIEVSESEAGSNYTSNRMNAPQVMVRNDLQRRLSECHTKIQEHHAKTNEFDGWVQVLEGNPENQLSLNADDYLFFFGSV